MQARTYHIGFRRYSLGRQNFQARMSFFRKVFRDALITQFAASIPELPACLFFKVFVRPEL